MVQPVISLVIVFSSIGFIRGWPYIPDKTYVQIHNTKPGANLTVHCRSKEDDLGVHVLPPLDQYEFQFKPSFFGGTLFYCLFSWPEESHHFDIYDEKRDYYMCSHCTWWIKTSGPCSGSNQDKCTPYHWKS
ncbi:hypothetical protein MLD38_037307 [Melastoma candidum]|uniref:Uncharacterized protein n=1 Tax=Melastoma candidum TaxID=119954 RepID=A0ACB9LP55_9MYRT|nr:hypothetical protein MLD38_037307 [Melastoma candidum]